MEQKGGNLKALCDGPCETHSFQYVVVKLKVKGEFSSKWGRHAAEDPNPLGVTASPKIGHRKQESKENEKQSSTNSF
jgi:hypothetical protein